MPSSHASGGVLGGDHTRIFEEATIRQAEKGAARRWANHNTFSRREGSLTKFIFYIALLKRAAMGDCQGDDDAEMDVGDDLEVSELEEKRTV